MPGEHNQRWFRRHPRVALGLFGLVLILVLDFVAGSVLYAAGFKLPAMSPNAIYREQHPVYHHGMRPNVEHEGTWGSSRYKVCINNLGLKDGKVRDVPLRSESKRVLLLGDSFTEGVGVQHEDTYAGMLAQRFADDKVEFLNAGVSSYSPTIYLRKAQHLIDKVGLHIDHACVAIDISDIFDETRYSLDKDGNVQHSQDGSVSASIKKFLARHTVLIGALRVWIRALKEASQSEEKLMGLHRDKCKWAIKDDHWKSYGERGMAVAVQRMSELHDYLKRKGIGLNIVIYPWPDQIMLGDRDSRQVKTWTAWAKKRGVDLINLFPDFIGATPPEDVLRRYFIRGDIHWNKAGHALVAARLEEYFRKR